MDNIFWIVSKVFWGLVAPETLLLFLLILGVGLLWIRNNKGGRFIITATVVAISMISILPFSTWVLRPLEDSFSMPQKLPNQVDGIIVLAGTENISVTTARGQPSIHGGGERLIAFIRLANIFPDAILLFVGGSGSLIDQKHKSGDTARKVFDQIGLDLERVQFESESKNTAENASKAYELIQPDAGENWILITSAFHMLRSVGTFRKVGWSVTPYPVDFHTTKRSKLSFDLTEIGRFSRGIREWIGILAYRATGRM